MKSINEAIAKLKKEFPDVKPVSYWKKESGFVIRTAFSGEIGCNYFLVTEKGIMGTNPIRADLNEKDMILL